MTAKAALNQQERGMRMDEFYEEAKIVGKKLKQAGWISGIGMDRQNDFWFEWTSQAEAAFPQLIPELRRSKVLSEEELRWLNLHALKLGVPAGIYPGIGRSSGPAIQILKTSPSAPSSLSQFWGLCLGSFAANFLGLFALSWLGWGEHRGPTRWLDLPTSSALFLVTLFFSEVKGKRSLRTSVVFTASLVLGQALAVCASLVASIIFGGTGKSSEVAVETFADLFFANSMAFMAIGGLPALLISFCAIHFYFLRSTG